MSLRIVAIDDDEDDMMILTEALRSLDQDAIVDAFYDSEQACTQLMSGKIESPDYVFIDLNMPKVLGAECLEMIRASRGYEKTIVVMISTTMSKKDAIEHVSKGADFAVQKPYSLDEYRALLLRIFTRRAQ